MMFRVGVIAFLVLLVGITGVYLYYIHKSNHRDMKIAHEAECEFLRHLDTKGTLSVEGAEKLKKALGTSENTYRQGGQSFYCQMAAMILLTLFAALFIWCVDIPASAGQGKEVEVKPVLDE